MGKVIETHIEDEMEQSYINYAMSVIRGRAIPNVRDGLKPVQLRILYGMHQLGLTSNKPTKKSARIVGEVMGKYHPHGDKAVYDTMVNMAQEFSYRYPLVDGQGNFGSLDGDEPAAMRYTEARLSPISEKFLEEIGEDTVDFRPNFDDSLEEPAILPTKVPNLLLNGAWGISVGMVTKIPPHNLNEVVDALIAQMKDPQISLSQLTKYIKGPDFPTGGIVMGQEQIEKTYRTGKGKLKMRAKARVEGNKIVITEIPYQIKKSTIVESIAKRVRNEEIEGISDLRDESDQKGLRIVVELKRSSEAELILKQLYNYTPLERTFGAQFLVIKDGNPQMLSLKELLNCFIKHRREIVKRRTNYRLDKAEARAHILEGLKVALENKEELVRIISQAESTEQAKESLQEKYELTEKQVKGVLRIRLSQFTKMEVAKIKDEHDQKLEEIKRYKEILGDPKELDGIIKEELLEIKKKFGDSRRTTVVGEIEEPDFESLIPDHDLLFTITEKGYANAPRREVFKKQNRAGKGVIGLRVRNDDRLLHIFPANSREDLLIFSADNQVYGLHASHLPSMRRDSKGKTLKDLIELEDGEKVQTVLSLDKNLLASQKTYCLMATESGIINRNLITDFQNAYTGGIIALGASEDDLIVDAKLAVEEDEVILGTAQGRTIRFPSSEVRCTDRPSKGVIGIRLNRGDKVVGIATINPNSPRNMLLLVTEKGYGKRTNLEEFNPQSRGGKGVLGIKVSRKTGKVVTIKTVSNQDDVILITKNGKIIKIDADSIRTVGRYAKGVHLIKLEKDDKVTSTVVT